MAYLVTFRRNMPARRRAHHARTVEAMLLRMYLGLCNADSHDVKSFYHTVTDGAFIYTTHIAVDERFHTFEI